MNDPLVLLYWKCARAGVKPDQQVIEAHRKYQEQRRREAGIKPKKIGRKPWTFYYSRKVSRAREFGLTLEGKPRVKLFRGLSAKALGHAGYMAEWRKLRAQTK